LAFTFPNKPSLLALFPIAALSFVAASHSHRGFSPVITEFEKWETVLTVCLLRRINALINLCLSCGFIRWSGRSQRSWERS